MFDKVFKHEVLFIGYLILAVIVTNPWAGLWWAVVAIVHSVLMLYYTFKRGPKGLEEKQ